MSFRFGNPSPILSPFVKNYWAIENHSYHGETHVQRIIPCGLPELSFYFDAVPDSPKMEKAISARSIIGGQQTQYFDYHIRGRLDMFSIAFHPNGLSAFFNIPASEFSNLHVPLKFILTNESSDLESKLYNQTCFEDRIKIVEVFLMKRLAVLTQQRRSSMIWHILDLINKNTGNIKIQELATTACLSRKQFERKFLHSIGNSPKQFLKTVRFQKVLKEKSKGESRSLTELANTCGYFDQAHLNLNFKRMTGMTPKEYFSSYTPYSDYFE